MSLLSRKMKKSAETLTETYAKEDGTLMAIINGFHTPVVFIIATTYIPNPTGSLNVAFKDGDKTNMNVENLYWYEIEDRTISTATPEDSKPESV